MSENGPIAEHPLLEVRGRALNSLRSKLENKLLTAADLQARPARSLQPHYV